MLTDHYTSIVGDISGLNPVAIFTKKESEKIIKKYFNGSKDISSDMFERTFKKLSSGVSTGYGSKLKDGIDGDMVYHLKNNVRVFSAFKANHYKDTMISLLVDKDNKKRSWGDFFKEAQKVDVNYNKNWLAAEYNMAIRQARGAEQWNIFERDKETYPNLEYMPSRSANNRMQHEQYYGMILSIDHPFWVSGYPPLDWGCKCWVKQSRADVTEYTEQFSEPTIPKGLAGNAAKEKKVFTASSNYLDGLSKQDKNEVKAFLREQADLSYEEIQVKVGKNKITIPIDAHANDLIRNTNLLYPVVKKYKRDYSINSHIEKDGIKNPEFTDDKRVKGDGVQMDSKNPLNTIKGAFKKLQPGKQLDGQKTVFLGIDFLGKLDKDNLQAVVRKVYGELKANSKVQYVLLVNNKKALMVKQGESHSDILIKAKKELL